MEAGDASLGYSSEIWVAGWFQARFQMRLGVDDALFSPFSGVCVALLQGMVFFAVVSGRGGGRVRDPVEAAFQGRSGHITPS